VAIDLPDTPQLGKLEIVEVYAYFDGVRLLACKDSQGRVLLAVWARGDERAETWYAAPISKRQFRDLRFGTIDLRTAFANAESGVVWRIESGVDHPAIAVKEGVSQLGTAWLPDAGEKLKLYKKDFDEFGDLIPARPPDLVEATAKMALGKFFEENPESVFTSRQIEIRLERQFFHWITNRALHDIVAEGLVIADEKELETGGKTKLMWPKEYRYYKRSATRVIQLVEEYSSWPVASTVGEQGEMLVLEGFARNGFVLKGRERRDYGDRAWSRSRQDLDFIFEKDGTAYGVEVKNTLGYMDYTEMTQKIELCGEIGVRPVFAARMLPTTWIREVAQAGGFALIMGYQMYPRAHAAIAHRVKTEMGLPVDTPHVLLDKTMERFMAFHRKVSESL
jgi:hypothetical protein